MPWPVTVALQLHIDISSHGENTTKPTPPKIIESNLKMMLWKMIFLFQGPILRFHVNLPGCRIQNLLNPTPITPIINFHPKLPDENSDGPSEGALDRAGDCSNLGRFQRCLVENSDFLGFFFVGSYLQKKVVFLRMSCGCLVVLIEKKGLEEENLTWSYRE